MDLEDNRANPNSIGPISQSQDVPVTLTEPWHSAIDKVIDRVDHLKIIQATFRDVKGGNENKKQKH